MNVTAFDSLPRSGDPQLLVNALVEVIDECVGCNTAWLFADFIDSTCGDCLGLGDRLFVISLSFGIKSDLYVELFQSTLRALSQFSWDNYQTIAKSFAVLPDSLSTTLLTADALYAIDERWPAASPKT